MVGKNIPEDVAKHEEKAHETKMEKVSFEPSIRNQSIVHKILSSFCSKAVDFLGQLIFKWGEMGDYLE